MHDTHTRSRLAPLPRLFVGLSVLCTIASTATPLSAQVFEGVGVTPLPQQWSFRLDREGVGQDEQWFEPDVASELTWQEIEIAAPWPEQLDGDGQAAGWYWTPFEAPEIRDGERLWLEVGQIKGGATVYVNGEEIAEPPEDNQVQPEADAGDKQRRYDITAQVQPGDNDVMIRVESGDGPAGITQPAVLRHAAVNYVSDPRFSFGLNTWRLYINGSNERVDPVFAPGYYFGEQSVHITAEPDQLVVLDHRAEVILHQGKSYRLSVRYRQQLDGPPTSDIPPVRLMWMTYPKRGDRQPHDKFWVHGPSESTDGWEELTGVFEAQENYTGFRFGVFLYGPGVFEIDEFSVSPVGE